MSSLRTRHLWGCLVCPLDAEGYLGWQGRSSDDLFQHFAEAHGLGDELVRSARATGVRHLCGARSSTRSMRFKLPDGRCIAAYERTTRNAEVGHG